MGSFILNTQFFRLFAADGTVYVEAKEEYVSDQNVAISIQALLGQGALHHSAPHDFRLSGSTGGDGGVGLDDLRLLWDHLALSRQLARALDVNGPPDNLNNFDERPPYSAFQLDHAVGESLTEVDLLNLAATAHPKTYPTWWVSEKRDLIAAGAPDALVPRSARPRKRRRGGAPAVADRTAGGGPGPGPGGGGTHGGGGALATSGSGGRARGGYRPEPGGTGGGMASSAGATRDARESGSHRGGQDGSGDAVAVNRSSELFTTARPHTPAHPDPSSE